jgi:hypothetical protein
MLPAMSRRTTVLASLLALAAGSTPLAAQTDYRLDENGNWVATPVAPLTADQQVIADARQALADNKPRPAIAALSRWIDENGTGNSPLLPEAYLLRADARTASGDEYEALYDYEKVIMDYPATEQYARAVERELGIAVNYVGGLNRRWFGFRVVPADDVGEELLVRVQERMPGSRLAEDASLNLAKERRIYANIGRFKGPDYDASGLAEAKILIEEYTATNPAAAKRAGLSDALMARLDESTAAQLLSKARYYLRRNDPVSARHTLQRLVRDHPETVSAARAAAMLQERNWPLAPPPVQAPPTPENPPSPDQSPAEAPAPRSTPAPPAPPPPSPPPPSTPPEEAPKP